MLHQLIKNYFLTIKNYAQERNGKVAGENFSTQVL